MKAIAGGLKLDLANFRELEAFAGFGAELDKASQQLIDRGRRLVELLKQTNGQPMPVEEQVVTIFAGTNGYLDDLAVVDVRRFETELLADVRARDAADRSTPSRPASSRRTSIKKLVEDFKGRFVPRSSRPK